jgi:lipoprotein NlpD
MMSPALRPVPRSAVRRSLRTVAASALVVALVAACATRSRAPIEDRTARPPPTPPSAAETMQPPPTPAAAAPAAPESDWRPPTYTVKRGDTLHAIALDHGLDYRDVAAWNNLENPNRIEIGQVLRLGPPNAPAGAPGAVTTAPLRSAPPIVGQAATAASPAFTGPRNSDNYKSQPKLFKEPYSEQAVRDAQRVAGGAASSAVVAAAAPPAPSPGVAPTAANAAPPPSSEPPAPKLEPRAEAKPEPKSESKSEPRAPGAAAGNDDRVQWTWPANGKIVAGFSETANLKGIDIGGSAGSPVVASAAGKVVYAGSAIRGYGKLIIVKHNTTYLSAYGHNREILVKEGQQVARGQKIAEMGNTDTNDVKLHFEIRRLGKPVDPLKYLPPV